MREPKEPKAALLIVDIQKDFCPGGALPVPNGDEVVVPTNRALSHARKNKMPVLLSRDWHPFNSKHFKPHGDWPPHCVQNTPGAQFHPELKISGGDYIVSKGADPEDKEGYSAFKGTTYFRPLDEVLRYFKIKILYICGLATDYCVKTTVLDACKLGYKTYVLKDACRAVNLKPDDEVKALTEMLGAGATLTTTDEFIRQQSR